MAATITHVRPIIGLEVHVQLATRRKMFAAAPSGAWAGAPASLEPNTLIDETVLALPGTLPVMNRAAVELSMLVGLLLRCQIAPQSKWDRKAYFYPDLPKAYQISQYDLPLCFDGAFDIPSTDDAGALDLTRPPTRIGIIRAHLEEDAGKLLHEAPGGFAINHSIVDYNRAGTPLLEIVTQPDFTNANDVVMFARLLRAACRDAGATLGVMERGHMRFEPNINCELTLSDGRTARTPIVEVKNLNSFRALKGAIEFEIADQPRRFLEDRREMGKGAKTTRGYDDARGVTVVQRSKEDADDYRYFPDPDLPTVIVDEVWRDEIASRVGETPYQRLIRLVREVDLDPKDALAVVEDPATARFLDASIDAAVAISSDRSKLARPCANLVLQNLQKVANERGVSPADLGVSPEGVASVAVLRVEGSVGSQAVDVLLADQAAKAVGEPARVLEGVREAAKLAGLLIVRDEGAMAKWIQEAIAAQPQAAADVRAGKQQAMGRLLGEVMKRSGGQADAKSAREALLKALGHAHD